MTTPSNTQTLTSVGRLGGPIERLLVELALSVLIVLSHFTSECSKILPMSVSSKPAGVLAAAYTAATLVSVSIYCFRSKLRLKHKVLVDEREKHRVSMRRSKKVVPFSLFYLPLYAFFSVTGLSKAALNSFRISLTFVSLNSTCSSAEKEMSNRED